MRHRPVTLILLLLVATAAGADGQQGGAPLETSKKALQELQADQATKSDLNATGKSIADGLPQLRTPAPGVVAPEQGQPGNRRAGDNDLKKKKAGQANWLLDGVDKLGRETKDRRQAGRDSRNDLPADEEEKPDSSDPDYVLKLYAQQKKEAEEKTEARQVTRTRTDPIAPFLQDWLGNSPVRGKFFDEYVRKSEAGAGPASAGGPADIGSNQLSIHSPATMDRPVAAPVAPQPNPYLAGLESPANFESGTRGLDLLPSGPAAFGGDPSGPSRGPAMEPNPAPRAVEKKPTLLAPLDNEKYFPQQKKF
ncbi:MAG: hypothetical protein PSV13_05130 [Lacunisphaera sp.]|nr:hypothetical protein [Lacunisphaera sp.]